MCILLYRTSGLRPEIQRVWCNKCNFGLAGHCGNWIYEWFCEYSQSWQHWLLEPCQTHQNASSIHRHGTFTLLKPNSLPNIPICLTSMTSSQLCCYEWFVFNFKAKARTYMSYWAVFGTDWHFDWTSCHRLFLARKVLKWWLRQKRMEQYISLLTSHLSSRTLSCRVSLSWMIRF